MKSHRPSVLPFTAGLGLAVACSGEPTQIPDSSVTAENGAPSGGTVAMLGDGDGSSEVSPSVAAGESRSSETVAPTDTPLSASGVDGAGETAGTDETSSDGSGDDGVAAPASLIGDVSFSVPSQTFEGSLSVSMAATIEGQEIRYATDGRLPTASSALYDGEPLDLTETTQLRAQPFEAGVAVGLPSTAIYVRRTFDVTSDIPLVIMEAYGGGKPPTQAGPEKVIFRDLAFMLFEVAEGAASLSAIPTWASRAGYHVRGQSSASFEKTPYRVELWDNDDEDADYPMIGMPADSDWAMVGPYSDKTLVRNAFVYSLAADIGLEAPELRFAEVYLNQDEGPLEAEDYQGVYAITETIKNKKGRLDLRQLRPEDTLESDLSGGYIFKFDEAALRADEGEIEIFCMNGNVQAGGGGNCFSDLELTDPVAPNAEQLAWIQSYVQQTHDSLHTQPIGDYQEFLDLASFVDQFLINELTKGGDIYTRSVYMHKERNGPIKAGPVWDYNFTLNNFTRELEGWQLGGREGSNDWFEILFEQPEFRAAAAARFRELRRGVLADAQVDARFDAVSAPLVNAGPRDLERWPVGEGTGFFANGGGEDSPETWEGQIADVKQWIKARMAWLDTQFATF